MSQRGIVHSGRETVVPRDLIGAYLLLVLLQQSDRVQVLQGASTVVRGFCSLRRTSVAREFSKQCSFSCAVRAVC